MVPLFALLLLVTSAGSSVSSTGFVDADAAALKARLRVEVGACAGAVVDVELPVPCDEVCVAQHAASAHVPRVVSMAVLRVGNDVDVQERVVSAAGKVELSAHRSVEAAVFLGQVLSPEACSLLKAPMQAASRPPLVAPLRIRPAWVVAAGGGAVVVLGAVLFGVEASILEDAQSPGADKKQASVAATIGLAAVGVGILVAWAGTALALNGS